ncbi:MAG: Dot/Icm T4SS effector protein kinase CoxK1 [Candidatus Zixiibacteriota bacterium]
MPRQQRHFDLVPGQTLGRNYFIVEFLGSGWEGEVYKVEERRTHIPRAAKVFYPSRQFKDRQMRRYAQKLYRLRRCSIVTQYLHRDIARVGREQVEILVSDLFEGEPLSTFLGQQPKKRLKTFEALHLFHALVQGIEEIHVLREYHGDIHLDNVLVQRRGLGFEVSLIDFFDFGRATAAQIQGDVYDLIGILYELIGGARGYAVALPSVRQIILGRKRSLIRRKFRNAGDLRLALENLSW